MTGGRDSDSRSRGTHKHTKLTKTQKPLTHGECFAYPHQHTHACCGAVPCGAVQTERHTACLHHLLRMRDKRHTCSRWMYIKPFNYPGSRQGQSFLFSTHSKPVHQSAFVHPPDRCVNTKASSSAAVFSLTDSYCWGQPAAQLTTKTTLTFWPPANFCKHALADEGWPSPCSISTLVCGLCLALLGGFNHTNP